MLKRLLYIFQIKSQIKRSQGYSIYVCKPGLCLLQKCTYFKLVALFCMYIKQHLSETGRRTENLTEPWWYSSRWLLVWCLWTCMMLIGCECKYSLSKPAVKVFLRAWYNASADVSLSSSTRSRKMFSASAPKEIIKMSKHILTILFNLPLFFTFRLPHQQIKKKKKNLK